MRPRDSQRAKIYDAEKDAAKELELAEIHSNLRSSR